MKKPNNNGQDDIDCDERNYGCDAKKGPKPRKVNLTRKAFAEDQLVKEYAHSSKPTCSETLASPEDVFH
jgi:hypothetical protein